MNQFSNASKDAMTRKELKEQRARKKREQARLKMLSRRTRGNDYYRLSKNGALKDVKQIEKKFRRSYEIARVISIMFLIIALCLMTVLLIYRSTGRLATIVGKIPAIKSWLDATIANRATRIGYLAMLALAVINFIGARAYGGREKDANGKKGQRVEKEIIVNRPFTRFVYITLLILLIGGTFAYDFLIYCGGDVNQWKVMFSDSERLLIKVINFGVINFINLSIADEKFLAKRAQAKHERMTLEEMDKYNGNIIYARNPEDFRKGETGSYHNLYHVEILPTSYSVYLMVTIKNIVALLILHMFPSLKIMLLLSVINIAMTFLDVQLTIKKQHKYEKVVMNAIIRREQAKRYSLQYNAWKNGKAAKPSMYRNQEQWLLEERVMSDDAFTAHIKGDGYKTADSFYRQRGGQIVERTDKFGKNKGQQYTKGYREWIDDNNKYDIY